MSRFITNAAHSPGFTCVAFNSDGKLVLTGGDDCTARLWKVDQGNDQEPDTSTEPDQPVTSIAVTVRAIRVFIVLIAAQISISARMLAVRQRRQPG